MTASARQGRPPTRPVAEVDAPAPGELLLDPAVPAWERLTVSRNGWSAAATHVWTGAAWVPLVPGPVRVPAR